MINVFLAEDDQFMARLYERAFKVAGFGSTIVSDGETSIKELQSMTKKPDIVLLDVMMPKKTGFEVLKLMKENESLKNIPVILLTNLFGQENEKKAFELGAELYLTKSQISSKEIVVKIKDLYTKKILKQ